MKHPSLSVHDCENTEQLDKIMSVYDLNSVREHSNQLLEDFGGVLALAVCSCVG